MHPHLQLQTFLPTTPRHLYRSTTPVPNIFTYDTKASLSTTPVPNIFIYNTKASLSTTPVPNIFIYNSKASLSTKLDNSKHLYLRHQGIFMYNTRHLCQQHRTSLCTTPGIFTYTIRHLHIRHQASLPYTTPSGHLELQHQTSLPTNILFYMEGVEAVFICSCYCVIKCI